MHTITTDGGITFNHYSAANRKSPGDDARLHCSPSSTRALKPGPSIGVMSNGKVGAQGLRPHDDIVAEFPHLGVPNRYPGV
jgi:hypothetical protein